MDDALLGRQLGRAGTTGNPIQGLFIQQNRADMDACKPGPALSSRESNQVWGYPYESVENGLRIQPQVSPSNVHHVYMYTMLAIVLL